MTTEPNNQISPVHFQEDIDVMEEQGAAVPSRFLYWFEEADFFRVKKQLVQQGFSVASTKLTPCQVMKASGKKVVYATPEVWSRMCVRQGSWYRDSRRAGQYMMMSEGKLPDAFDAFLDAEIARTDFIPDSLPSTDELQALVDSEIYQTEKPEEWEKKGVMDAVMFKILFTLTRFWKWGDNLRKHWLSHKANHANFLARHFTAEIDGESVPYSVVENSGICSSCVEYFNIIDDKQRKLVRACPGSVTFGGTERDVFLDVKPV